MARGGGAGVVIHADGTPLTAEEIATQEAAELADAPGCEDCGGTGGKYTHAASCDSEWCVGNGDMHSCSGTWAPCDCNSADAPAEDVEGLADSDGLMDPDVDIYPPLTARPT
jgi:hypothetical protein